MMTKIKVDILMQAVFVFFVFIVLALPIFIYFGHRTNKRDHDIFFEDLKNFKTRIKTEKSDLVNEWTNKISNESPNTYFFVVKDVSNKKFKYGFVKLRVNSVGSIGNELNTFYALNEEKLQILKTKTTLKKYHALYNQLINIGKDFSDAQIKRLQFQFTISGVSYLYGAFMMNTCAKIYRIFNNVLKMFDSCGEEKIPHFILMSSHGEYLNSLSFKLHPNENSKICFFLFKSIKVHTKKRCFEPVDYIVFPWLKAIEEKNE
ncbi:hypothetical protein EDEG_00412 [Edhazardia aedis USNM 41457]|uniref:Uncharacterized protein n=1 Tax=Edhazardia aedis (strain USNM 41457) TaxID=1003232 RepID=J9DG55_EDHAE|nr:hypothetical protein EDEG_00412 [Edhazardia aedis USNM 41457]|eukprot:EJW01560.1 hypothetical protein EDEG_00412 [Edhazardia aedis USNM 41457]